MLEIPHPTVGEAEEVLEQDVPRILVPPDVRAKALMCKEIVKMIKDNNERGTDRAECIVHYNKLRNNQVAAQYQMHVHAISGNKAVNTKACQNLACPKPNAQRGGILRKHPSPCVPFGRRTRVCDDVTRMLSYVLRSMTLYKSTIARYTMHK